MAKNENKNDNKVKKNFFKDFKAELKRVIWPTPKQLLNNTTAVVTIVIITAIIVFALDAVFDLGNKYGISKLQSIVNEKYNNTESTNSTDNSSTDIIQKVLRILHQQKKILAKILMKHHQQKIQMVNLVMKNKEVNYVSKRL